MLTKSIAPRDIIEDLWVFDLVDQTWETFRLRRVKATFLDATLHEGLADVLAPVLEQYQAMELANRWYARDRQATVEVLRLLEKIELTMDAAMARTFVKKINEVEQIERAIRNAEARRNATLREIDRHRDTVARRKQAEADVVEGEYSEVPREEEVVS